MIFATKREANRTDTLRLRLNTQNEEVCLKKVQKNTTKQATSADWVRKQKFHKFITVGQGPFFATALCYLLCLSLQFVCVETFASFAAGELPVQRHESREQPRGRGFESRAKRKKHQNF